MTVIIARGVSDSIVERIMEALKAYEIDHPQAQIHLYRQNPASVRVRIVDPDFAGLGKPQRNQLVWKYFDALSEDEQSDISMLLLLTEEERKSSFANLEFDDPVPSQL